MTIRAAKTIAAASLLLVGSVAAVAVGGAAAAAPVTLLGLILPGVGEILKTVVGHATGKFVEEHQIEIGKLWPRTGRDGLPINHDLARLVREAQCEAVLNLVESLQNEAGFVRAAKQWAARAKEKAVEPTFMVGGVGHPETGVEAHIDVLMRLDAADLAKIAAQETLEEIRTYAGHVGSSVPPAFVVRFERDWLVLTEALFADALKADDNKRARNALSLKFMRDALQQGEDSAVRDLEMKACLDAVLGQCDAFGQRLLGIDQKLQELLARTPARETLILELRRTVVDRAVRDEVLERLALQFPSGQPWDSVAHQVDLKVRELLETPLHGRDVDLAVLDRFIDQNDRGLMIVEGAERSGKSALLAHWSRQRTEHVVRHFAHNGGCCTLSEEETLGHLDVQLSALTKTPASSERDRAPLRGEVFRKIDEWSRDRKLVVMVDGLDKITPALLAFFTKTLPTGVYLIVSCAIGAEATDAVLKNWRRVRVPQATLTLAPLEDDQVRSWVRADLDLPPEDRETVARDLMDLADRPAEMRLAISEISKDAGQATAGTDIGDLTAGARARIAQWKDHLAFLAAAMRARVETTERFSAFNGGGFDGATIRLTLDRVYTGLRSRGGLSAQERHAAHDEFTARPSAERPLQTLSSSSEAAAQAAPSQSYFTDGLSPDRTVETLDTLAVAMRERRQMVILGEPASGKSTLLRWLDLKFAQAWLAHDGDAEAVVQVPAFQVDPFTESGEPTALDRLKLPIFVTMAEIANHVADRDSPDLIPLFARKLSAWAGDRRPAVEADVIVEALVREGRLMILLDGLDEVIDLKARARAIDAVAAFSEVWSSTEEGADGENSQRKNRLVITSRIVGYEEMRLPEAWPHVTIERMEPDTVLRFWRRLFKVLEEQGQAAPPGAAETLHTRVYGPEDQSIAQLAGVPLLATLLAVIFQTESGTLPRRRIEIYDRCVELLVTGRRTLGDGRMDADRWRRMLGPVAAWMHDHAADGLIVEGDYRALLTSRIQELWPDTPSLEAEQQARRFIIEDRNAVGLLMERGEGRFGFLHRTFQEYLAAAWIMDDPEEAAPRMASRWRSPAWREPFLLALGHPRLRRSEQERLAFFDGLLDCVSQRDRPRLAMQLVSGIPEMPEAPGQRIISRLIGEILAGLRKTPWRLAPDILRQKILDCLYILADLGLDVFEAALCDVIAQAQDGAADPTPEIQALAEILVQERWSSRRLAEAIVRTVEAGSGAGTTPLYRTALQLSTLARHPDEAPDPPSDQQGVNQIHRMRVWRVKTAYAARRPYSRSSPDARALMSADPRWRPVAIAFCGALGDHDAARVAEGYHEISEMLQLPNSPRLRVLQEDPSYIRRFGIEDTVYAAAVHLDTVGGRYGKPGRHPVVAEAENSIATSKDAAVLLRCLGYPADSGRLLGVVADTPQARAVLRLAAALMDDGDGQAWFLALKTWPRPDREALQATVRRAIAACADGCYRALMVTSGHLSSATETDECVSDRRDADLPVELAWSLVRRLEAGVTLRPAEAICRLSGRLRSERLRQALEFARSDDPRWEAAKVLDLLFTAADPGALVRAMAESDFVTASPDALWPSTTPDLGLSSPALDWLLARHPVHRYRDFGDVWRALPFDSVLKHHSAAAFTVSLQVGVTNFDPSWAGVELPAYIAARIELALVERGLAAVEDAEATVRQLALDCEPAERFMLLDQLIALSGQRSELVDAAVAEAALIDDPRDRWRALGRATRYAGARSDEIRVLILRSIASIDDVATRRRDRLVAAACLGSTYAEPGVIADEPRLWWKAELMALLPDVPESPDYRLALSIGQRLTEIASWLTSDDAIADPDQRCALDASVAEAIDAAWRADDLDRAATLDRLEIVSVASLAEARHWLGPPESPLAFACAFALLAHEGSPTLDIVRPLLQALLHGDDADAAMAAAALTRGTLAVRRPPLEYTIGQVGLETVLAVATVAERNRAEAGSIGKCFIADVRFDDASKTSELCDLAETGDATALFAVEALSHVDASSVEVLAARLKGPPRMRKAVLAGLASIFESSAPNVKDAVITALQERLDHLDADVGAWPGGGAGVALAIGDALRSADPESSVRQAMEILSAGFIPLGTAIGDGRGPEILEQMYHRSTLMGDEHIPSQHGRAEFELIRKEHGAPVIDIAAEWLADVVAKDPDDPVAQFLLFGLSEYAVDNPMLVTRALLKHTGGRWDLDQVLIGFSQKAAPAALRLACRIGPISVDLIQALVTAVATPNSRVLNDFDRLLETTRVHLAPEAVSWIIASADTPSVRRAYAVIRLLGTVTENPNAPAGDRIAAQDTLNAMAHTDRAAMHMIAFTDSEEGVGIRDHGVLSHWILRALAANDL